MTLEALSSIVEARLSTGLPGDSADDVVERPAWYALAEPLSARARIGLMAGTLEWVLERLRPVCPREELWQARDATWMAVLDRRYVTALALDEAEGPAERVLARAFLLALDGLDVEWQGAGETGLGSLVALANLTRSVTTPAFDVWMTRAAERLGAVSPRTDTDFVGNVVPREALELARPFDPATTRTCVRTLLDRVARGKDNPFLGDPDQLRAWGLEHPYTFDVREDPEVRVAVARAAREAFHGY